MFTGIVECVGEIIHLEKEGSNLHISVRSTISTELRIDQSVSHNGVCLTVVNIADDVHTVTAIDETLNKTNIGKLHIGSIVNLERCMPANGRFDGHIVQGHVDTTVKCLSLQVLDGSWEYTFELPEDEHHLVVNKGSICINGTSLTCFDVTEKTFKVAIIPYTFENTVFKTLNLDDQVNIEFDIIGKYLQKMIDRRS